MSIATDSPTRTLILPTIPRPTPPAVRPAPGRRTRPSANKIGTAVVWLVPGIFPRSRRTARVRDTLSFDFPRRTRPSFHPEPQEQFSHPALVPPRQSNEREMISVTRNNSESARPGSANHPRHPSWTDSNTAAPDPPPNSTPPLTGGFRRPSLSPAGSSCRSGTRRRRRARRRPR
jgi:hypothetical protein